MVNEWKKRDVFKNKNILKINLLVLIYFVGIRDGVYVVKVFLIGDGKGNVEF